MEGMVKITGLWKQRDMNGQTFSIRQFESNQ